jgi:hypothetical protein
MKRQDTFFLWVFTFILVLVGLILFWRSRSEPATRIATQTLRLDSLDTERQLVEIKADSLTGLFQRLQQTNEGVFEVENGNKSIEIQCQSGRETAFNRLFFNDESLSSFAKVKNNSLDIRIESQQFVVKKYEQGAVDYVKIPAEMLQSMLLSVEN